MAISESTSRLATPTVPAPLSEVSPACLRGVMSQFATGVVVLTVGGEHIHGMTANAFSSVSLDPPTVLCCVSHQAVMHSALLSARRFAISILGAQQEHLARYFADKSRPLGAEQFGTVEWFPGPRTGAPLLAGSAAWLECELDDSFRSGDHSIFVGAVVALARGAGGPTLVFYDRAFHRLTSTGGSAQPASQNGPRPGTGH